MGFRSATGAGQRRVEFSTRPFGHNALDRAVETAAASGWALYELPARHTVRTDAEAVGACAALAARTVQRGAISYSERAVARLVGSAEHLHVRLLACTPSPPRGRFARRSWHRSVSRRPGRLQGREFDIVIVRHPLSGRRDATAFHLEAGRLCVRAMCSRRWSTGSIAARGPPTPASHAQQRCSRRWSAGSIAASLMSTARAGLMP